MFLIEEKSNHSQKLPNLEKKAKELMRLSYPWQYPCRPGAEVEPSVSV